MLRRVAIVNRGEAALRLIHAVREINYEYGRGIRTIAFHTDAERRAMFVRESGDLLRALAREYGDRSVNIAAVGGDQHLEVSDLGEGVTRLSSPRHGEMVFQHQIVMPEAQPDLRIIVFIPARGS